ncbi:MAG: tRNA pseudouridine(38-40) synthase TruA [candidate division WOR-3 bacterium]
MNYLIICEFDGRGFEGWQSQPSKNTVQDKIEEALCKILGERIRIVGAGRTDAGVSAFRYPFSFKTQKQIDDRKKFLHGLNSIVDKKIFFHTIKKVNDDFSARFSCKMRVYKYFVYNGNSPLKRPFHWQVDYILNNEKMREFILSIKGKHDFSSFCRKKSLLENNCVDLKISDLKIRGKEIVFTFGADRFLHNMVRFIVGTAIGYGRGKIKMKPSELLKIKDVKYAGKLAPPEGLIFYKAVY